MKHSTLIDFINTLSPNTPLSHVADWIFATTKNDCGDWLKYGSDLANFIKSDFTSNSSLSIIKEGNNKLKFDRKTGKAKPFLSFSTLPFSSCPGMGACSQYCYSVKAFRYPAAFYGMLKNTLISWHRPQLITAALDKQLNRPKYKKLDKVNFRLFVDGDIDSIESMDFWMSAIGQRPKLATYGYSKSLDIFAEYAKTNIFPNNYKLNLSNGSRWDADISLIDTIKGLSIYRGEFVAIQVNISKKASAQDKKRALISAAAEKGLSIFPCPTTCAGCTAKNGHACGSDKFKGITIGVPIH